MKRFMPVVLPSGLSLLLSFYLVAFGIPNLQEYLDSISIDNLDNASITTVNLEDNIEAASSNDNLNTDDSIQDSTQQVITTVAADDLNEDWYRKHLNSYSQTIYDAIEAGLRSRVDRISIPSTDADTLSECFELVLYDNPDIFWVDYTFGYLANASGNATALVPRYETTDTITIEANAEKMEDIADSVVSSLSGSDYDKAKGIYDWICQNVTYSEAAATSQDIESALLDRVAACAGYAHAYQYIARKAGIDCIYITGEADTGDGDTVLHAWNAMTIDGETVYLDVTWGDRDGETVDDYSWFCLSLEDIEPSHDATRDDMLPIESTDKYEIWTITNSDYDVYNEEQLYNRLETSLRAGDASVSVRYGTYEEMDKAYSAAIDSNAITNKLVANNREYFTDLSSGVYTVYKDKTLNAIVVNW